MAKRHKEKAYKNAARSNDRAAFSFRYAPKSGVAGAREPVALALVVVRVQELLGLLAALGGRLAEVVLVEGLDQMTYRVSHARIIPQRYKPPQPGEVPRHALWRFAADDAFATAAVPALAFQRRLSSGRPSRTCAVKLSLPRLPPPPVATAATRALAFCRGLRFGFSTPTVQRSTEPLLRGKAIASPLTTAAGRNCRDTRFGVLPRSLLWLSNADCPAVDRAALAR